MKNNHEYLQQGQGIPCRFTIPALLFLAAFLWLALNAGNTLAASKAQAGGNTTVSAALPASPKVASIVFTCNTWGMLEPCST